MSDFTASNGYTVFHREHDSTTDLVLQVYAPDRTETLAESLTREQVVAVVEYAGSIGIHAPGRVELSNFPALVAEALGPYLAPGLNLGSRAGMTAIVETVRELRNSPTGDREEFAEFEEWRAERARVHRTEEAIDAVCRAAKPFPIDRTNIKAVLRDLVAGVQAGDIDLGES